MVPKKRRSVVFLVNSDRAFLTHRSSWALAFQRAGFDVTVMAPDTGYSFEITQHGFSFVHIDLGREQLDTKTAVRAAVQAMLELMKRRPRYVLLVQTAAYTLGWTAALLLWRTTFLRVAGGVGRALGVGGTAKSRSAQLVRLSLKLSCLLPNVGTLFQLEGDRRIFLRERLAKRSRSWVVPGTGVDLEKWYPTERNDDREVVVALAARLYAEKGIYEFAEATAAMRDLQARFVLIGAPDDGVSTSVPVHTINSWVDDARLEWWGHRDDMASTLRQVDLLVFPSRHPEGTPRTLIEAAASGVPAIASDQEGCRVIVDDGISGWILEDVSAVEIERTVRMVLRDPSQITDAARAARRAAERRFGIDVVIEALFSLLKVEIEPTARIGGEK